LILAKYHRILKGETGKNNQPPRPQISFTKTNKHFTAATPPSKRGEMYNTYIQYLTFVFVLNSLPILLYLTPKVDGYAFRGQWQDTGQLSIVNFLTLIVDYFHNYFEEKPF
jgi:hypothetical protein